jgi:hypothetical protein
MIKLTERKKMKKVFKTGYAKEVLDSLNQKEISRSPKSSV